MKKILLFTTCLMLLAQTSIAELTCTQTRVRPSANESSYAIIFECVGTNGAIEFDASSAALAKGKILKSVTAVGGANLPDAGDITVTYVVAHPITGTTIFTSGDLLGAKGTGLIPASTTPKMTFPYDPTPGLFYYPRILGVATLTIANQDTDDANVTIVVELEN